MYYNAYLEAAGQSRFLVKVKRADNTVSAYKHRYMRGVEPVASKQVDNLQAWHDYMFRRVSRAIAPVVSFDLNSGKVP